MWIPRDKENQEALGFPTAMTRRSLW